METLLLVIHVLAALALVGLVLLQHGKGADVGTVTARSNQVLMRTG